MEEQTGRNMERRRKASNQDDENADRIPERRSYVMMNRKKRLRKEGKVHIVILNQARKLLIKVKDHNMKMSQGRRLPRQYSDDERDETMLMLMQMPSLNWTPGCTLCRRRRDEM